MPLRTPADLLIEARWVLPVLPDGVTFADGAIAVSAGRILAIGTRKDLAARFEPAERIVRPHHLLMPGLVNAHTPAAMTLLRALPVRAPLSAWLRETVWPAEGRSLSPDFVRDGTRLAVAEMVRAGITTFGATYAFPEETARVVAAARVRAAIGVPIAEAAAPWAENATACLARAEQLWDAYRGDPWVSLHYAPQAPYALSEHTLRRVQRVADELEARVTMPLHQTELEVRDSLAQYGMRPLQRLSDSGLLRPDFTAVHMTQLEDEDLELAERTGIAVIACPQSDLRLGNGATPLTRLLERGLVLGLGSAAAPSCGALDILAEARTAALTAGLNARTAVRLATLGGAATLGLQHEIGSLEPGKAADLLCLELGGLECQPIGDAADTAVFAATRSDVSDVWIAGRAVVASGSLLAFDVDELRELAGQWQRRIALEAAA